MFTLIFFFLLLNIPLLVTRSIHPRCFWRINQNEDKDEDLMTDCAFPVKAVLLSVDKDYFNQILNVK
jgi:vomeronasal 2 receptor